MSSALTRPGVSVFQQFRTTSPTVVTPTLVPTVVGVCRQIVEVQTKTAGGGSVLNPDSLVDLPAYFATTADTDYTGLDGLALVLSITGSPDVTTTLSGNSLSPAQVATQINAAFLAASITSAVAEATSDDKVRVRTYAIGEFESIEIRTGTHASVLSAFGLSIGYIYYGVTVYQQGKLVVPPTSFPDPRGNIAKVSVEPSSVRCFLGNGGSSGSVTEVSKTTSYLRRGAGGLAATITGTTDMSAAVYPMTNTLIVSLDGATPVTVSVTAASNFIHLRQQINTALGGVVATASGNFMVLSSLTTGYASTVEVTGGTGAAAILGSATVALTRGTAGVRVVDDGNGDSVSPLVAFTGANWGTSAGAASCTGLVDTSGLTYASAVQGKTLTLSCNGSAPQTITFSAGVTDNTTLLAALNAFFGVIGITAAGTTFVTLTASTTGDESEILVVGGTAAGNLGFAPSVTGVLALNTQVLPDLTALNTRKLKVVVDGVSVEHTFSGLTGSVATSVSTNLNANTSFSALAVAEITSNQLRIRSKTGGKTASVSVAAASSLEAAAILGLNVGASGSFYLFTGAPFAPAPGDTVYVDGGTLGTVVQVSPGSVTSYLKVNKQLPITLNQGARWHIVAKNLTGLAGRPTANMTVGTDGEARIKHSIQRDAVGQRVDGVRMPVYLQYSAIRQDVTALENDGLLVFSNTTEVFDQLFPIDTRNPLGLAAYIQVLAAPGIEITALGVDEVSADETYGTLGGFARAFEYLEVFETYSVIPLTHSEEVAQIALAHAVALSDPESKSERIVIFNFSKPTRGVNTTVASSVGNTVGSSTTTFDTGISNLSTLLLAAGVTAVGTIPVTDQVFLDISSDAKSYSISDVTGSVVTIRTAFTAGQNDDLFYSTTVLAAPLINEIFAIRIRGKELVLSNGQPDKAAEVAAMNARSQGYGNRRFWNVLADGVEMSIGGVASRIEGFYAAAAIGAMNALYLPSQSFTNFPMSVFTHVYGTHDTYKTSQLDQLAYGGHYILTQQSNGPVYARMALTTDTSSIETRTDSITKAVDYSAKFLRTLLRNYIGRYNITQGYLDTLGAVIEGGLDFLEELSVIKDGSLNNLIQDEDQPDAIIVDVTLDPLYPCNYIRVYLSV